MTKRQRSGLRSLEGRQVGVALADGSRLDGCTLVSAGRGRSSTAWFWTGRADVFLPLASLVDIWETA
jgi:hypothetical protein